MSDDGCCNLAGNFSGLNLPPGCIISVNNNISADVPPLACGEGTKGRVIGTLNISGYAGGIYRGCGGRASAEILWLRKYDCELDTTHFIFLGPGRSSSSADSPGISIMNVVATSELLSASSQSGPASIYTKISQKEGFGMAYSGEPISFDTSNHASCMYSNMGPGTGSYHLQNFNIEFVPGSTPVANYTFVYNV